MRNEATTDLFVMNKKGPDCLHVQRRRDADQEKSLGTACRRHYDRLKEPTGSPHADARAPCACGVTLYNAKKLGKGHG